MKSAVAYYQTRVLCLRIVPVTGITVYMTDHPRDLVMSGHTYISTSGYQFTGYDSRADFSPASIDIEGILGSVGISRAAVASGVFDGARCYVFATTWASPVEDQEPIVSGIFGKTSILDDRFQIGGVSLIDALNQSVGQIYSASCPKTFCGQEYGGCMASLAANTVTGTVYWIVDAYTVQLADRSEPDDTFGGGTIRFTTGPMAGLKAMEIKTHDADMKYFTTFEPFYYLPEIGDEYEMVRGCRKRLSDCQNRVGGSNVVNFGGFPWVPTSSTYAKVGQGGQ